MKTLVIQTHELAKVLDPSDYTCHQLERHFVQSHNMHWSDAHRNSSIVMEMLYKEQKEFRKFDSYAFRVLENIFQVEKYDANMRKNSHDFSDHGLSQIRQRLINSLLTRPDRTLCVLIPE